MATLGAPRLPRIWGGDPTGTLSWRVLLGLQQGDWPFGC